MTDITGAQDVMQEQIYLPRPFRGWLFLLFITYAHMAVAINPSLAEKPPTTGNFSLATSQQPGPFFSFGQNIIDKNQLVASFNRNFSITPGKVIICERLRATDPN